MNVLSSSTRRASLRALVGFTAVALTAGAASLPAASAAPVSSSAAIYGSKPANADGVYRQSLAILGLHAAGLKPDASAVQWLLDQQCANGGFSSYNSTPSEPCAPFDGDAYTGGTDTNASALAVQALLATGHSAEALAAANYLKAAQNSDGGWQYTVEDTGIYAESDPNSTGLVLTALDAAGLTSSGDAIGYLADFQVGQGVAAIDPADNGAISPSWAFPVGMPNTLATVQAVPGAAGANLLDVPSPTYWAPTARAYPTAPAVSGASIAGWGSTWIAGQIVADAIEPQDLAWSIISLASAKTAKDQAEVAYARLRGGLAAINTNPGALGQAALVAKSLGKTADLAQYGHLIEDTLQGPPTATFTLSPTTIWATQSVTVQRTSLTGTSSKVKQTVNWGDGTTTTALGSSASTFTHAYSGDTATRSITVTLTNATPFSRIVTVGSVKVTKDTTGPKVALTTPSKAARVSSWTTIKGTSSDVGVGVKSVTTFLTEKRGKSWYSYTGSSWQKKSSAVKARSSAKRIIVTPTTKGAWSLKVKKLKKGSLKMSYYAKDKADNRSATTTKSVTLKK